MATPEMGGFGIGIHKTRIFENMVILLSIIEELRNESPDESGLFSVAKLVRGERNEQHGDMRERGMVTYAVLATNAWFLNGYSQ